MPPISSPPVPRIVIYYQTQHHPDGGVCSILPIIKTPGIAVTHVNVAAIHLNDPPGNIHLNDHPPSDPRYVTLWAELRILQASGIKVLGMLGGAAQGSFTRLDLDEATFEAYYIPLRDMIRERGLDGLDLDVEEAMTLAGIVRLIDRLKKDFGDKFIITLAPVAAALMSDNPRHNLSGFSYEALEVMRGKDISWYNTQFYCGWGDLSKTDGYDFMIARGFPAEKIVAGVVTNPANGHGWVSFGILQEVLITLKIRYPGFGGIMGWEYFNSLPGDRDRPWEWAALMTKNIRNGLPAATSSTGPTNPNQNPFLIVDQDPKIETRDKGKDTGKEKDKDENEEEAPLPKEFEYFSDDTTNSAEETDGK